MSHSWRKKYAGMTPLEMRRLKALPPEAGTCANEKENARLKKPVADLSLDREIL